MGLQLATEIALVEMETLLSSGIEQTLFENIFSGILGQLEVVHTGIDRRVDIDGLCLFLDNSESRVEVSQASWWKRTTASHKLDEGL